MADLSEEIKADPEIEELEKQKQSTKEQAKVLEIKISENINADKEYLKSSDLVEKLKFLNSLTPAWLEFYINTRNKLGNRVVNKKFLDAIQEKMPFAITKEYPSGIIYNGKWWLPVASDNELKARMRTETISLLEDWDLDAGKNSYKAISDYLIDATPYQEIKFNSDMYKRNFQNGTYDIRTNTLLHFDKNDYIVGSYPTEIDPTGASGTARTMIGLMQYIIGEDWQTLAEAHGYQFFPSVTELPYIVYVQGKAGNGKSLLMRYFIDDLGELVITETHKQLIDGNNSEYHLVRLRNMTGHIVAEAGDKLPNDMDMYKMIIDGSIVTGRAPGGKPVEFEAYANAILGVNNKLPRYSHDAGVADRLILLEATAPQARGNKAEQEKRDKEFPQALRESERPAFIAYVIQLAYKAMKARKYTQTQRSKALTANWINNNDMVGQFIKDHIVDIKDNGGISARQLYIYYQEFMREAGQIPLGRNMFNDEMRNKDYEITTGRTGSITDDLYVDDPTKKTNRWKKIGYKD